MLLDQLVELATDFLPVWPTVGRLLAMATVDSGLVSWALSLPLVGQSSISIYGLAIVHFNVFLQIIQITVFHLKSKYCMVLLAAFEI